MWLLPLLACAARGPMAPTLQSQSAPSLNAELMTQGDASQRSAQPDGADLVLIYSGEQKGSLDPCGCPTRPRGGLARAAGYLDAMQPPSVATVVVNGGYWLDDALALDGGTRPDVSLKNQWMVRGLSQFGVDALNVGVHELGGLASLSEREETLPLVSANVLGEGIAPFIVVERDGLRVGITGISSEPSRYLPTHGFTVSDPVDAATRVIASMQEGTDLVVLLSFEATDAARTLARRGGVDVVVDTAGHRSFDPPVRVGDAIWVRSHYQTMRLGELRLGLDEGRILWATDRKIDLDETIADQLDQQRLSTAARGELRALEREIYGRERR